MTYAERQSYFCYMQGKNKLKVLQGSQGTKVSVWPHIAILWLFFVFLTP